MSSAESTFTANIIQIIPSMLLAISAGVASLLMTLWLEKRRRINHDGKTIEKIQHLWSMIAAEFMHTAIQIEWVAKNKKTYIVDVIPIIPFFEMERLNETVTSSDLSAKVFYDTSQFYNLVRVKIKELEERCKYSKYPQKGDGITYGQDIMLLVLHHLQHLQKDSSSHFKNNKLFLLSTPKMVNLQKTGQQWAKKLAERYRREFKEECPLSENDIFSGDYLKKIEEKCRHGEY